MTPESAVLLLDE